jgi:hypothetical protein
MEDYRRTIRLGRLLRQEDVMLMNGWTGLRMIQDGLEAIHRRQREAGDAEGASRTALALCSLMAERLEMLKVFDVLLFGSDVRLNWWRLRLVVPEWRVETIRRYASSHPSRAVRIESLNSLAILVGLLDSDARRTVSETLSRLEADHDPIVAKFAEQYVNRAGARATPTSHDLGSGTAEPGGR